MSFVQLVRSHACVKQIYITRVLVAFACVALLFSQTNSNHALYGQSDSPTSTFTPTPAEETTTTNSPSANSENNLLEGVDQSEEQRLYALLDEQIDLYLAQMTVEDKIGQLFIVTFEGDTAEADSNIARLIREYRVGGVVLSPRNGNITNSKQLSEDEAVSEVARIVNELQALSYGHTWDAVYETGVDNPGLQITTTVAPLENASVFPNLPLFIAVEQAGDGLSKESLPDTSLRRGFTELPSQLAIGATWDTNLSRDVASIVGKELSAVGINLLLGPYLDVLNQEPTGKARSLGIYSFGGDPFWVSRMGKAYIEGLHQGSSGRVLSIARHFPGQGGSDRLPYEEIATIPSDEQTLQRIHLPPFVAVTSNASGTVPSPIFDQSITDGLMTSHMHFSGLQGDPVDELKSFGFSSALATALQSYPEWRRDGLMMTGELGTPAIRKNYAVADSTFPFRRLTMEAFLAGHDLLYLSQFGTDGGWQNAEQNMADVITLFQTQYSEPEEGAFREKVDQSVKRILKAKLRLYGADQRFFASVMDAAVVPSDAITQTTTLTTTLITTPTVPITDTQDEATSAPDATSESEPEGETGADNLADSTSIDVATEALTTTLAISIPLESVLIQQNPVSVFHGESRQNSTDIINRVAEESLTLLFPNISGDLALLPTQPQANEKIVIISDNHLLQECSTCLPENLVNPQEIEEIIIQRYGQNATQQIQASQIKSATFSDLSTLLRQAEEAGSDQNTVAASPTSDAEVQPPSEIEANPESADESDAADPEGAEEDAAQLLDAEEVSLTEEDIGTADWIIFAMLDIEEGRESSDIVRQFLSSRGEQLRDKKLVVLALNAPYFLDTTGVSRLKVYYGVNSKIRPFLVTAVRTLFQDASLPSVPQGSSPVSASGTRFGELAERLLPDPERLIPIEIWVGDMLYTKRPLPEDTSGLNGGSSNGSSNGNGEGTISVNDQLLLRAIDIRDRNGNIVKDGTPVTFEIRGDDGTALYPDEVSSTINGVAERVISLDRLSEGGTLTVIAESGNDAQNAIIATSELVTLIVQAPELPPTPTTNGDTVAPENEIDPTAIPESTSAVDNLIPGDADTESGRQHIDRFTLFISLITILGMASLLIILQERIVPRHLLVRNILWAIVVGLLVYVLYGLLLPIELGRLGYPWAPPLAVFVAMLIPLLVLQLRNDA